MELRVRTREDDSGLKPWKLTRSRRSDTCSDIGTTDTYTHSSGEAYEWVTEESMEDVVTPNFKELIAKGVIINNPMAYQKTMIEDNFANYYTRIYSQYNDTPGCPDLTLTFLEVTSGSRPSSMWLGDHTSADFPSVPSVDSQRVIDLALTRAWANVDVSEATALVSLAEAKKSVLSIASIFKRFLGILRKLKRLDAVGLANELSAKELADRYMELRYALRPLMFEASQAVAAIKKEADNVGERLTFRAREKETSHDTVYSDYESSWTSPAGTWYRRGRYRNIRSRTVEVRSGVLTKLEELSQLSIWGFTQPIEAMWELVPLSFVIDWFFNIGDTLASWTPNVGLKTLASWYVVSDMCYRERSLSDTYGVAPGYNNGENAIANDFTLGNCRYAYTINKRYRVPDPSRPTLPSFKLRLNSFKLADLVIIGKNILK